MRAVAGSLHSFALLMPDCTRHGFLRVTQGMLTRGALTIARAEAEA